MFVTLTLDYDRLLAAHHWADRYSVDLHVVSTLLGYPEDHYVILVDTEESSIITWYLS